MIITFCGLIGSGKDTAADYLVSNHGFVRDSFAASLKDAVSHIFGWDRNLLEGRTAEARAWREEVDSWWANRLGIAELTPRWILQHWGTEVCRIGFHKDIWVASLENRLRNSKNNIVITDVRFPNEIKAVHNLGGYVIRIKRGDDPSWYKHAVAINQLPKEDPQWAVSSEYIRNLGIHLSETSWVGSSIDVVIPNNGTIAELYANIGSMIKDLELNHLASTTPFEKIIVSDN